MSCKEYGVLEPTIEADLEQKPSLLIDSSCSTTENDLDAKESSQDFDPLFMDCLPSDFSTNPKLSALASFLNDEDYREEGGKDVRKDRPAPVMPSAGGGKVRRRSRGITRASIPYLTPQKVKETRQTSIGEAQLFLKMWKL
jgi:hypothetical protein